MGMGGGKGGGGSTSTPKIQDSPLLYQGGIDAGQIGSYLSTFLNYPIGMGNWAMDIATGGNASTPTTWQDTSSGNTTPRIYPASQNSSENPYGLVPGSTAGYDNNGNPIQVLSSPPSGSGWDSWVNPNGTTTYWNATTKQTAVLPAGYQQQSGGQQSGGGFSTIPGTVIGGSDGSSSGGGSSSDGSGGGATWIRPIKAGSSGSAAAGSSGSSSSNDGSGGGATWISPISSSLGSGSGNQLGPLLSGELNAINAEQQLAGTYAPGTDPQSISNLEKQFFGNSNLLSSGLYPDQQALIDTATKSGQAQLAQQMSNEGLSSSTQAAELSSEIGQQGAADAGQLIQGNQQLAQGWAKLGMGEQTLGLAAQQDMFNMFSQIGQQYGNMQENMWAEAMQGYGLFGNFVSETLNAYGLQVNAGNDITQANVQQAQIQAGLEEASMQAQTSASSSMFGALGNLFSSGGSGGLGSLFGSGAGALGSAIGAGSAAGGAASGSGAALDAVITAIGAAA